MAPSLHNTGKTNVGVKFAAASSPAGRKWETMRMEISGAYSGINIFETEESQRVESRKKYSFIQEQTTPSGDSVDISDEAKRLYSQMIHKYDGAKSGGENAGGEAGSQGGGQGAGGAGGAGGDESANSVEEIRKQIESLKSQLSALASGGQDAGNMSKMQALEAQIAALQAQLNAAQAA